MSMNATGGTLMEPLAAPCRAGDVEGSGAPVVSANANGAAQKPISRPPNDPSQSSTHPLPALRRPLNGEWHEISSPQKPHLHPSNALHNATPHMMRKTGGTGSPLMMPHLPSPPGGPGCCASPRPAPPRMQRCGPPLHASHTTSSRNTGPIDWSAMSGSSGPWNRCQLPSQARRSELVMSVARGPQPTSVEPTRLMNGKKIKDVERRQQAAETQRKHNFTGPAKAAVGQHKEGQQRQRQDANSRTIKTTVGSDDSWMKGLTYSTWVDSPKGLSSGVEREGPYKRRPRSRKKNRENSKGVSRDHMGKSSLLMEALRNLFR
ncbi:hypothetical protein CUR178_05878 [Leishmania enriettii]|uniref:Uncharacterized protein n=1 Tax=Leishmania enriettii TaxID=5663 RepID=A0A836KWL2_LEIEN|nr:hypothetical protein CUR178_05878 [Leishmania enriettii]